MSEERTLKRPRKGTKSCTECRRRKVRCIRESEFAPICRRCEERGSKCVEQAFSTPNPGHVKKMSSRQRISQLEYQVAHLSGGIRGLESKLGYQPMETPEYTGDGSADADASDSDSSGVDVPDEEQPTHIRSLFQNDWLVHDSPRQDEKLHDRKNKTTVHMLDVAKKALQDLLPSQEEFLELCKSSSVCTWLGLLQALLPQPFVITSQEELLYSYEEIMKPDVTAMNLATWLLTVAITCQQNPQEDNESSTKLSRYQGRSGFSRSVADVVENRLLRHERMVSSVEGLSMGMHWLRLEMSLGHFRRGWFKLRHIIAIAELMGLPTAQQLYDMKKERNAEDDESLLHKAQLWEAICVADRVHGLTINLPPGTRRFPQTNFEPLVNGGVVNFRAYLSRLTSITTQLQDLDDMNVVAKSQTEIYASTLVLDRSLRDLASQTLKSWWALDVEEVKADHLVQFIHFCTLMRIHLPFTMRQNSSEDFMYSHLTCVSACKSITKHYQFLRRRLPSGIFLSRILDLQAFTATVVLLLTSLNSPTMPGYNPGNSRSEIEEIVTQVVELMDQKSNGITGSNYGQHGAAAIRSLHTLLQQDSSNPQEQQDLNLKVPLLGALHVRRNVHQTPAAPQTNGAQLMQSLPDLGSWKPTQQDTFQQSGSMMPTSDALVAPVLPPQDGWQLDPFSWSLENYSGNFFHDPVMADTYDSMYMPQNGYDTMIAF